MRGYAADNYNYPVERFSTIFWNAANATEEAYSLLAGTPLPTDRYTEADLPEYVEHDKKLRAHWHGCLRDELAKCTYAPLTRVK
jgi:hypothetical protein